MSIENKKYSYTLDEAFEDLNDVWDSESESNDDYDSSWYNVVKNGRVVASFDNRHDAEKYAKIIGGEVVKKASYFDEDANSSCKNLCEADEEEQSTVDQGNVEQQAVELTKSNYEEFVKKLDSSDAKSRAFAEYIKDVVTNGDEDSKLGKVVKLSASETTAKCNSLKPTQNAIYLYKSLGDPNSKKGPLFDASWLTKILNTPTKAFGKAGEDNPEGKIIVYGNAIIDGHHRWSKIFAIDGPDADCSIIKFDAGSGVTNDDMLKATQLAIRAVDPNIQLISQPKDDAAAQKEAAKLGPNMYEATKDQVKEIVDAAPEECIKLIQAKFPELDSRDKVTDHLFANIKALPERAAMHDRKVMPQTDAPNNSAGGAVDLLKQGVIDTTK